MKQRILAGRVLIDPVIPEEKTVGGIIVPDSVNKRPTSGTIVVTGKSLPDVEMEVKVGDSVVFNEGAGMETEIDGKKYILMEQRHINYWIVPE